MSGTAVAAALFVAACFSGATGSVKQRVAAVTGALVHSIAFAAALLTPALRVLPKPASPAHDAEAAAAAYFMTRYVTTCCCCTAVAAALVQNGWFIKATPRSRSAVCWSADALQVFTVALAMLCSWALFADEKLSTFIS
jgi:hypothetical protein